jgi:hypothetical protein
MKSAIALFVLSLAFLGHQLISVAFAPPSFVW